MKTQGSSYLKRVALSFCAGVVLYFTSSAQCVNNMATKSYDTVLTGIGYGNYQLNFPKWNPDSGLLASVRINARVSVHYAFTLKNVDLAPSTYSLWVGREDAISSVAMSSPYDNIVEKKIGVFPLAPGSSLSQGPFTFLDNYLNTDSITANTAPFLGTDNVRLAYAPVTYTTLRSDNNSSYGYHAAAMDTVHFTLSYTYCRGGGVLATDLTGFSAILIGPASVQLHWSVTNPTIERQYQVQRSWDGLHFSTIASLEDRDAVSGAGTMEEFAYTDDLPQGKTGKCFYRLQLTDPAGMSWSAIREVVVSPAGDAGLSVYPNPAVDFVNLSIDPGSGSGAGWEVELLESDGSRIFKADYPLSNVIHFSFPIKLAPGIYLLRTRDLQGRCQFINRILIR